MTTAFYLSYAALWVIVIFHTLVLLGLVRGYGQQTEPPSVTLPPQFDDHLKGQPLPEFVAHDIFGAVVNEASVIGQRTALLFVSPSCSTCSATLEELQALESKSGGQVVIVCQASDEECRILSSSHKFHATVVVDADGAVSRRFGVNGTPTAIIVSEQGTVETYGHPMRGRELEKLFARNGDWT